MTETIVISLLVFLPQIQAANGKLLGLKVTVPRLIISTELEKITAVPGKETSHFLYRYFTNWLKSA